MDSTHVELFSHIIVLLCGLPGCGKTRFAKELETSPTSLFEALKEQFKVFSLLDPVFRLSCVHFDNHLQKCLLENGGNFTPEVWKQSREEAMKEIEEKVLQQNLPSLDNLAPGSASCHVIVVDDNMNYSSMRKQVFDIAFQHRCGYVQVMIDTPLAVCIERNSGRDEAEKVQERVIRTMTLEPPGSSSKWWDTNAVILSSDQDWQCLPWSAMADCLLPSPPDVPDSATASEINSSSYLHQLDLEYRKIVGRKIVEFGSQFAPQFSRLKALFLAQERASSPLTGMRSLEELISDASSRLEDEINLFALMSDKTTVSQ